MPGIVGIINRGLAPDAANRQVAAMVECMRHERFYTSGTCSFPNLGIHAGWIAHEGSMAADQVFWNEASGRGPSFCRRMLCRSGSQDPSEASTARCSATRAGDWLVHLYEEKGEEFFESLNGLFSGLLIDLRHQRAFLFNDRYGIERLYWFEAGEATYFATEAKALLRVLPQLRAFDPEGVTDFLAFGCTLEWRTLFRGMHLAPGGSLWRIENGECRKSRYFDPVQWESLPILSDDAFQARFQETFTRLLPRYFASDSEVGISLTGGLDTRMIMAGSAWNGARPVCYTFAGQEGRTLDARIAAQVAKVFGLDHRLLRIDSDFLTKFAAIADRTIYITDGCFGVNGAHEIYLNGLARQLAPVRITGNFGSEVLRSMSTFKPLGLPPELFHPDFRSSLSTLECTHSASQEHPVTFAAFREIPWSLFGSLAAGRSQVLFRTPYLDNELVALAFQAPQRLRQSPASALRFVQHASPALNEIPTDRGLNGNRKGLPVFLRHLFSELTFKLEYLYNDGPPEWLSRMDPLIERLGAVTVAGLHKYLPYRHWYRKELASYLHEAMARALARQSPFWNVRFLRELAPAHVRGQRNYVREINAVLTLETVERTLLQEPAGSSGKVGIGIREPATRSHSEVTR